MKCKKCGFDNSDDSKFCTNCGSRLKKSRFVWVVCIVGLLFVFCLFALMYVPSDVDGDLYIHMYDAFDDAGLNIALKNKTSDFYVLHVYNDSVSILVNISTGAELFNDLYDEGLNNEIVINNITAYEEYYKGHYLIMFHDNNCSVVMMCDDEYASILQDFVRDY